jgi:hypothetical protein
MAEHVVKAVGIAWYRKEEYLVLRALFEDGQLLPETYDGWLAKATALEKKVRAGGQPVERVFIEPSTFPAWCASRGLALNTAARTRFAADAALDRHGRVPS